MNAAAKTLSQGNFFRTGFQGISVTKEGLLVTLLTVLVLCSALAVIYIKNAHRLYFSELQNQTNVTRQLDVEYGQLLLEQSTWNTPSRVQRIAHEKFDMIVPEPDKIVIMHTLT